MPLHFLIVEEVFLNDASGSVIVADTSIVETLVWSLRT